MSAEQFNAIFRRATNGNDPLPYQERLALSDSLPSLLDVPTGLGKTAAAILAWIWRRRFCKTHRDRTPRRLVYCLPMRVLVEQTYCETVKWLYRLELLAGTANWTELGTEGLPTKHSQLKRGENGQDRGYEPDLDAPRSNDWASKHNDQGSHSIAVHLLLGGEEKTDWALWPERDAILIGTQDMLISRALNRGYAAGRARWPLEFGLLNSDCLWVFDEIQIMDTSLATSLQLDAWRRSLRLRPSRDAFPTENSKHLPKPCHSLWMSATMAKHWLDRAVDWSPRVEAEWGNRHQLSPTEQTDTQLRSGQLFQVTKQLRKADIAALEKPKTRDNPKNKGEKEQSEYLNRLANYISKPGNHAESGLTLVIVNTVDRATKLFDLLRKQSGLNSVPIKLIHSRFRPHEREQWSDFLNQKDNARRVLVATQVVEAGVDLSASVLYTELAPWASLVQRFGRCARYPGESGQVFWLDLDLGSDRQPVDHCARPYERSELVAARDKLSATSLKDVGLNSLTAIKFEIDNEQGGEQAGKLFPCEPRFVPRDKDLFDLFDTTPDLTGADVDVSRFIRDGEELDVQVFWRDDIPEAGPTKKDRPHRRELCPVPFHRFRELLSALRKAGRIWRRNYLKGWQRIDSHDSDLVYPGQVFLLEKVCGGYNSKLVWTGDARHTDFDLPPRVEPMKATAQDDEDDADDLSQIDQWLTVLEHTRHVYQKLEDILDPNGLTESEVKVLRLAARWHDRGKTHLAFKAKIKMDKLADPDVQQKLDGESPAKAPDDAWRRDKVWPQSADLPDDQKDKRRPGHRHELASALAILETLFSAQPTHEVFAWPDGLDKAPFGGEPTNEATIARSDDPLVQELAALSGNELDLLVYLVAAHHGKVRMSLRSSPDDERDDVPDPCPMSDDPDRPVRQARGIRDGDVLPACRIPAADPTAAGIVTPEVTLSLDPMELGLSPRYGASWRERMQLLLERLGPFRLGYLEALLRAADCRASMEEDACTDQTSPEHSTNPSTTAKEPIQ